MVRKADPCRDLVNLSEMMSRILDDEVHHRLGQRDSTQADWVPEVDLVEFADKFVLKADLPGMEKKDMLVEVVDRQLVLKGERRLQRAISDEKYHRLECAYGKFRRVFPLSAEVACGQVSATYANGVLEVVLPKIKNSHPKKISVHCEIE